MITRAKHYTKRKKKWTARTLGQMVKVKLYREIHRKKHTHTHSQKEKKIYIYTFIHKRRKRATKSINKSTNDNKL